jgi:uncharacterized protein (TIGR02246 family)
MRTQSSPVSLAFVLVIFINPYVSRASINNVSEEDAIRKVVEQYVEAFNGRDVNALTALFDKDADIVTLVATHRGLEEIKRFFESSVAQGGTITSARVRPHSLRFLRPDVAISDVDCEIAGVRAHDGEEMPTLHVAGTFLLVKNREIWMFSAMRLRTFTMAQPMQ